MSTIAATADNVATGIDLDTADNIVARYAKKWGARLVVASTPSDDEHLAVVMHDDHVFAAASSKISQQDAVIRLAGRIRTKSA